MGSSATLEITRKDIILESRTREMLALEVLLCALILLLFRAASEGMPVPVGTAIWVTLVFAATAGLSRTFHAEADLGTLDLLVASPAAPGALYLGKTLAAFAAALLAAASATVLAALFFGTGFIRDPVSLSYVLVLGAFGLAAMASFFSALSARSRTRAALFPLLMIPLAIPLVLWAARATVALSLGVRAGDPSVWLNALYLALYDALFVALGFALAPFALER